MKQKLFAAFLLALPLCMPAQAPVKKDYQLSIAFDAGTAIHAVSDGYVIFGHMRQTTNTSPSDIFMLRLDQQGNQVSMMKYGSQTESESMGRGAVALSDGWLLAGEKNSNGYLLRLNNSGTVLWSKEVTNAGAFADAAALPGGGFLVTGKSAGKMFLARLGADGATTWLKTYTAGTGVNLSISSNGGNGFVIGGNKIWKIRLSDGTLVWEKTAAPLPFGPTGGFESLELRDITPAGPGQFAVTGAYLNDQVTTLYSAYYTALWKESGEIVWEKYFKGAQSDDINEGTSVFYQSNAQHLLIAGSESGAASAVRVDLSGKLLDSLDLGIAGYNLTPVMVKAGAYYVATGAALANFQNMNTFFYRSAGNALRSAETEIKNPAMAFDLTPNPTAGLLSLNFYYPVAQTLQLEIADAAGRIVWESFLPVTEGANQVSVDVAQLPKGMYWLAIPATSGRPKAFLKE